MNQQAFSIPSDAVSALERGNKLEAVKITRDTAWMTLKQARDLTDAFLEANPALKAKCEANNRPTSSIIIVALLLAIAALIFTLSR